MAFPTIPTVAGNTLLSTTTTTATTTHTFPSLTTLAPQAGDLLIAICVQYQGGTANNEFTSWGAAGFTETRDQATVTALDQAIGVAHKIATGSESGTFAVTSGHSFRSVNFLMRIPAATWHGTTIPEVSDIVRATNAVADVGSLNPAGWAAEDTLWIAVAGHSETSTTGSPPVITASPTNYSGDLIVARNADATGNITAGVAFFQNNAAAEDAGVWTVSNANRGNGAALTIAIRPSAVVPQTVDLTPATETDTAGTLLQVHSLAPAAESDGAQAFAIEKHVAITAAAEADAAQGISTSSGAQSVTLTPAAESDAAQALDVDKSTSLTPTAEADAAQALNLDKTVTLTPAAETDAAVALAVGSIQHVTLTPATEADAAQAVTVAKQATVTAAAESDAAVALSTGGPISVTLTPAVETDTAGTLQQAHSLTAATEADAAQALSFTTGGAPTHVDLTPATEIRRGADARCSEGGHAQPRRPDHRPAAAVRLPADRHRAAAHGAQGRDAHPRPPRPTRQSRSRPAARITSTSPPLPNPDQAQALSVTKPIHITLSRRRRDGYRIPRHGEPVRLDRRRSRDRRGDRAPSRDRSPPHARRGNGRAGHARHRQADPALAHARDGSRPSGRGHDRWPLHPQR